MSILYSECPSCNAAPVAEQSRGQFSCQHCGLTLKDRAKWGLFNKGQFGVVNLGQKRSTLAKTALQDMVGTPDALKVALGNIYSDDDLAAIAGGSVETVRPVKTILAQIILEQLNEECFVNVNGLRRGHGSAIAETSSYQPVQKAPQSGMEWQDEGNLFCTTNRLVLPSNQFTFIRLDRKLTAVQAFQDGIAIQRKREAFATYFVGCYPHEAALVVAYVMAKVPALRAAQPSA